MNGLITVVSAAGAFAALGVALGTTAASATTVQGSNLTVLSVAGDRHDICVGTLDSSGHQHPWFCINLPQTKQGTAR